LDEEDQVVAAFAALRMHGAHVDGADNDAIAAVISKAAVVDEMVFRHIAFLLADNEWTESR
jgi:hypothetical protein